MDYTKLDQADLDSSHQQLPVRGHVFVVALSLRRKNDFSCASTEA